jgi:hypothetical protein
MSRSSRQKICNKRFIYRHVSSALSFVPMSVESFGRLGAPALRLLGDLADQAVQAGRPSLARAAFISGALRELSVALCQGNVSPCRSGAYVATRASGRTPMRGLARPSTESVEVDVAPRVWILGFWLYFALRCVALHCAVCVQLHVVFLKKYYKLSMDAIWMHLQRSPASSLGRPYAA